MNKFEFYLGENMRPALLNKINESIHSQKINLANMDINDNEIQEIMDNIHERKLNISKFNFNNNNLSDKGALILSKCLQDFSKVTELSIQFNKIGKEGAISLFSLINQFPELDIPFHGNKITNVGEMAEIQRLASQRNSFMM